MRNFFSNFCIAKIEHPICPYNFEKGRMRALKKILWNTQIIYFNNFTIFSKSLLRNVGRDLSIGLDKIYWPSELVLAFLKTEAFLEAELPYNSVCHSVTMSQCHNVTMCVIRLLVLNDHNFTDSNPILLRFGMSALLISLNKLAS